MREYNLEGFVLRRFSLGEADRILTVFSREKGKIKLVAKGVRRGKAKLAGHLEPFCEVRLRVIKGKSLDIIIGAEATKLYDITSLEQDALSSAYLMCEILDRMLPEEQPNEPAFELLQSSLTSITNGVPAVLARQYFALKFLQTSGLEEFFYKQSIYASYSAGHYFLTIFILGACKSSFGNLFYFYISTQYPLNQEVYFFF